MIFDALPVARARYAPALAGLVALCLTAARPAPLDAQTSPAPAGVIAPPPPSSGDTAKTFFTRRDLSYGGIALASTLVFTAFDVRIAHWMAQPNVQGGTSRHRVMQTLSDYTGETTLTAATVLGYGIGLVSHNKTTAAVSLHMIEAQALTSVMGQAVRGVLGRARPSASPNDAHALHWGKGFSTFDDRAFPSLHSAAGFIIASGVTEELRYRAPGAVPFVAPALYAAALVPGVVRMYLQQHWASDVVAGAFLGNFIGARVVQYTHTHQPSRLDRILLGSSVSANRDGASFSVHMTR
ncbi:MAG TPA: phosphatase PAP2 family protein [Gemmatimonadaceae bacterium]